MIITKKRLKEEISKARLEEQKIHEEFISKREEERYKAEQFQKIWNRMDVAFADIDRRLTDLEKKRSDNYGPVCQRY